MQFSDPSGEYDLYNYNYKHVKQLIWNNFFIHNNRLIECAFWKLLIDMMKKIFKIAYVNWKKKLNEKKKKNPRIL